MYQLMELPASLAHGEMWQAFTSIGGQQ